MSKNARLLELNTGWGEHWFAKPREI